MTSQQLPILLLAEHQPHAAGIRRPQVALKDMHLGRRLRLAPADVHLEDLARVEECQASRQNLPIALALKADVPHAVEGIAHADAVAGDSLRSHPSHKETHERHGVEFRRTKSEYARGLVVGIRVAAIGCVLALFSAPMLGQRISDALRCENSKCVSTPNDGPVIVQLLKTIHEQDVKLSQQQARIQALEKAQGAKKAESKGRKK